MDNEPLGRLMMILLGGTFGLIPVMLFTLGVSAAVSKRRALRKFAPVQAVVLSARLIETRTAEGHVWYEPSIEYEYEIADRKYRSTNVWSGTSVRSTYHFCQPKAQRLLDNYLVGKTVDAFCNPNDPGQAFLIGRHPILHEHLLTFLAGFATLFVFGAAWVFGVFWQMSCVMLLVIGCLLAWLRWQARA